MLLASDQGATITVNGGETWSSWYNQPTAQFYHVSTDNQWPYWVYGGQQESGSVGIASRGNDGQVTFREWHPVGVEEYGYVAVDPLDPNIVYGGKITKYDKRTGQVQDVSPRPGRGGPYRFLRTAPVLFSPVDPKLLYFAGNVLFATRDGGHTWKVLSPDLSREKPDVPATFSSRGKPLREPGRRGVVYAVAPSHFTTQTVWCGTDDGLVWVTRDGGKTWKDVTPPGLTSWSKVSQIDAGHFSDETAYVAVNRIRCDDLKPYVYATHDGGKSWELTVAGLPDDPVNTVREDPKVEGLLYCGTERAVYVWVGDGIWSPLRLNMPATSIRDLVVHDDDLVVGTHGRSFWILDNVTPLRHYGTWALGYDKNGCGLFPPQTATRVRWNMNTDTPLPPEEPGGQNPPDGAMIDYWLDSPAKKVTLEVLDTQGDVVRRYSSDDVPFRADPDMIPLPTYWLRPPSVLPKERGAHRWLWDMRHDPVSAFGGWVPMQAIVHDTPAGPTGPWAAPGRYTLRLTVDGTVREQPLDLRLDPRVTASPADIAAQSECAMACYRTVVKAGAALAQVEEERARLDGLIAKAPAGGERDRLTRLRDDLDPFDRGAQGRDGLSGLRSRLESLMGSIDECDARPTQAVASAMAATVKEATTLIEAWDKREKGPIRI